MLGSASGRLHRSIAAFCCVALVACDPPTGSSSSGSTEAEEPAPVTETTPEPTVEEPVVEEEEPAPEPEPIVEPCAAVPVTGQVLAEALGDDGDLQAGFAWPSPRFELDSTGQVVTDHLTGLQWTRSGLTSTTKLNWEAALAFVDGLAVAELDDWRLPNINELESLVDYGASFPTLSSDAPFVDMQFSFGLESSSAYWTSTSVLDSTGLPSRRLIKSFGTGRTFGPATNATHWVLACRGDGTGGAVRLPRTGWTISNANAGGDDGDLQMGLAWPEPRFTVHGDGTVTDELTGLMWTERADLEAPLNWQAALDAVAAGNADALFGYDDWRLPNARELRSLVDYSRMQAPLPPGHPFDGVSFIYWTSTSLAADPASAAVVSFDLASDVRSFDSKGITYGLWRVRGVTRTERVLPGEDPEDPPGGEDPQDPPGDEDPEDPPGGEDPEDPPGGEDPEDPPGEEDPEDPPVCAIQHSAVSIRVEVRWVPNHKLVDVTYLVDIPDDLDVVSVRLVSVTSNEPENGHGDGNTACDWQQTDDGHLLLRAERSGKGSGRVYTVTAELTLACGHVIPAVGQLVIPHDNGHGGGGHGGGGHDQGDDDDCDDDDHGHHGGHGHHGHGHGHHGHGH